MNFPLPGASRRLASLACALLLGAASPSRAQPVAGPPVTSAGELVAPRAAPPTTEEPITPAAPAARGFVAFEWLDARGVPVRPGEFRDTTVQNYLGAVTLHFGPRWTGAVAAQRSFYSDPSFQDASAWSAALLGNLGTPTAHWQFSHESSVADRPLTETATQVRERTHHTALAGVFDTDTPWILTVRAAQRLRFAELAPSAREWPAEVRLGYRLSSAWEFGPLLRASFAEVTPGADLGAWSPQLALVWTPAATARLTLEGGPDHRLFYGAETTRFRRSVYGARFDWRPRRTTEWRLHANRELGVSYFTDLATLRRGEGFEWRQQLNATLRVSACHERHRTDYLAPGAPGSARADHSRISIATLALLLRRHTTLELAYRRTTNDSTAAGYSFVSEQWSLRLTSTL